MRSFMRQSKFRHTFGQPLKREECYENVRITKTTWDGTFVAVSAKYLAIILEAAGGGAFLVLPLSETGRVAPDHPLVSGHTGPVLDLAWSPFDDSIIASASDDATVRVWQIPDGGVTSDLTEAAAVLEGHQKRVGFIQWHPVAENILLSGSWDMSIYLWNVETTEVLAEVELPDLPLYASFNTNGTRFAVTCKDKMLRTFDTRSLEILSEGKAHEGAKPSQCLYLKDGLIFTTGFSRMSERQFALWRQDDLSQPMSMQELDTSNSVLFPFYDADNNLIYLCAKSDTSIRYFEITEENPYVHYLNMYQSTEPLRGVGFLPKRAVNVNQCEIARFYKILSSGMCQVIPMIVPRKSDLFQEDLYPETASSQPALTADQWIAGTDAEPIMMSLREGYTESKRALSKAGKKPNKLAAVKKTVIKAQEEQPKPSSSILQSLSDAVDHHSARPKAEPEPKPAPSAPAPAPTQPTPAPAPVTAVDSTVNGSSASSKPPVDKPEKRQSAVENDDGAAAAAGGDGGAADSKLLEVLQSDIRKLKVIVKGQERRIRDLEERLKRVESTQDANLSDLDLNN